MGEPGSLSKIGFVGAGTMGHGMCSCLLKAGYDLTVVANRNRAPIDDLVSRGAVEASSLDELAGSSDALVLCVSNSNVVEQVVDETLPALKAGSLVIDTGTSEPASTRALAARLASAGIEFAEAPVTGGKVQAAAGELGALVGAEAAVFERARPLLEAFCRQIQHFGAPGAGNTAKLINNYMVMGIIALVTEAFTKADEADVDWSKLYDVVTCGSADSGVLRRIVGNARDGDFGGYVFDVQGALKDMSYFRGVAEELGGMTPLATAVHRVFEQAVADGHGERLVSELLSPDVRGAGTE
ncbi:MAG: NAD(P)-dependent oxidoreductase [Pseudomonadota bacterium]